MALAGRPGKGIAMARALFAFDDGAAARRIARQLIEAHGLPPGAARLHPHRETPNERLVDNADELVSGGLLGNLYELFEGVLAWDTDPDDAAAYAEAVHRGGAVVRVELPAGPLRHRVVEAMERAGCRRHTRWSDEVPPP
jgi:hypothetical protein